VKPNEPEVQALNDAELARRALKVLAERKIVPTPETFADAFWESAGLDTRGRGLAGVLKDMGADLVRQSRMSQQEATLMLQAAQRHRWSAVHDSIDRALSRRAGGGADAWPSMVLSVLKQADVQHTNWTRARKLDSISRVIDGAAGDPSVALDRLRRLVESWGPALAQLPIGTAPAPGAVTEAHARPDPAPGRTEPAVAAIRAERDPGDALAAAMARAEAWQQVALRSLRALEHSCADGAPVHDRLRGYLAQAVESGPDGAVALAPRLIDVVSTIDREIDEERRVRGGLERLLGLLCDNLGQLAPDEAWLAGQLEPIRALLSGPIRSGQITAAERRLAALISQQTVARRGLQEAKVALTEMLATLLERVGAMGSSAEQFSDQVGAYREQLQQSPDLMTLSRIVHGLLTDTQTVRERIESSRADLAEARKKVEVYEARVSELEQQLSEVSTLVQKDPLTNALNRRGLEHAFRVESARATRYDSPLALAMLDLDNFKQVNDTLGHVAGDRALMHFVTTVHATLRPTDLTARSGGEEFCVIFPASTVHDGVEAIERLQRELARRPFQFEGDRLVLSFSAGVAQWRRGDSLEQLTRRADASLYEAKKAGKNRVFKAP
jgi:diguanylate cyclase